MPLTYSLIHKVLKSYNYEIVHQVGSHVKYRRGSDSILVPKHDELKAGTAMSVIKEFCKQNGLSVKKFRIDYGVKL